MSQKAVACKYDLNTINGGDMSLIYKTSVKGSDPKLDNVLAMLNSNNLMQKQWFFKDKTYQIIRYDKKMLSKDQFNKAGLFRSVIHRDGKVFCFSPPKSQDFVDFTNDPVNNLEFHKKNIFAEEFIEGTMINIFHDDELEIATRSSVGGKVGFFKSGGEVNTFRTMFLDAVSNLEITSNDDRELFKQLESFPKNYTFSFVLQHPKNRIVVPFNVPNLYLAAVYQNENNVVTEIEIDNNIKESLPSWVSYPEQYSFDSYSDLHKNFTNGSKDYKTVGVFIKNITTGVRTKIRNPNYETVRQLRGNQPKLQYRYLMLRSTQRVKEYLNYYPEHANQFDKYRTMVHAFTKRLHEHYISCYVKKEGKLSTYPDEYRTNMFKIHQHYINDLRDENKVVNNRVVIDYVNHLPVPILMHALNYQYSKAAKESKRNKVNQ